MAIDTLNSIIDVNERENFFYIKMCNKWYYEKVFTPWFENIFSTTERCVSKGYVLQDRDKNLLDKATQAKEILKQLEEREEFKRSKL